MTRIAATRTRITRTTQTTTTVTTTARTATTTTRATTATGPLQCFHVPVFMSNQSCAKRCQNCQNVKIATLVNLLAANCHNVNTATLVYLLAANCQNVKTATLMYLLAAIVPMRRKDFTVSLLCLAHCIVRTCNQSGKCTWAGKCTWDTFRSQCGCVRRP